MQVAGVLETCLYVNNLAAAERFYHTVLGLTVAGRQAGRHVFFRCGQGMLLLFDAAECSRPDSEVPPHGARGASHVALAIAEADVTQWLAHLAKHHVAIEKTVCWPQGGRSLYFRDPSGNSLELAVPRIWDGIGVQDA